ncbi:MAG TPA: hypothetical protein VF690_16255 [Hymenobacter sp.]
MLGLRRGRTRYGTDAVFVELLDFRQTYQSLLAILLADLNPVNNQLLFEVGTYGDLLAIRNLEQIEEQWQGLRPQIVQKYGRTAEGRAFIEGFEQRLGADTLLRPRIAWVGRASGSTRQPLAQAGGQVLEHGGFG